MQDYALQFNADNKSFISLGTLGNLGSQLWNGFFCKFDIKTTQLSATFGYGAYTTNASSRFWIIIGSTVTFELGDNTQNGNKLKGAATSFTKLNDGKRHTVEIQAYPATNTISIKIDEVEQTITYYTQQTPSAFNNFTGNICFGARNLNQFNNTFDGYFTGVLDNLLIGISPSNIYARYGFNEGTGTVAADSSGNNRTATLSNGSGGSKPTWVAGLRKIFIKVSGAWKTGSNALVRVNGSWKRVKRIYIQIGGAWKVVY